MLYEVVQGFVDVGVGGVYAGELGFVVCGGEFRVEGLQQILEVVLFVFDLGGEILDFLLEVGLSFGSQGQHV